MKQLNSVINNIHTTNAKQPNQCGTDVKHKAARFNKVAGLHLFSVTLAIDVVNQFVREIAF